MQHKFQTVLQIELSQWEGSRFSVTFKDSPFFLCFLQWHCKPNIRSCRFQEISIYLWALNSVPHIQVFQTLVTCKDKLFNWVACLLIIYKLPLVTQQSVYPRTKGLGINSRKMIYLRPWNSQNYFNESKVSFINHPTLSLDVVTKNICIVWSLKTEKLNWVCMYGVYMVYVSTIRSILIPQFNSVYQKKQKKCSMIGIWVH